MLQLRNRYFLLIDILLLAIVPALALALRLDLASWTQQFRAGVPLFTILALLIKVPVFHAFGLYRRYWRYASVDELFTIVLAVGTSSALLVIIFLGAQSFGLLPAGASLPRSVPFIDSMLTLLVVGGTRFSVRALEAARHTTQRRTAASERKRVLIAGAGDAGASIVREIHSSAGVHLEPVGFVDDDLGKHGVVIHGVPVLGTTGDIPTLAASYDVQEVIIAMPSAPGKVVRRIVELCEAASLPSRTMPGLPEILSGRVGINMLRHVDIEDLLRREPVQIDPAEMARLWAGTRVLVTGAGGSIGSELCRQIARYGPARLALVGHGENSLFAIENELRLKWPALHLDVVVADIRDAARLGRVFEQFLPQVIFHAAAHKHVPLMESNAEDAVTNNVGGTRTLVTLAVQYGVERFVLISSDKAVNPANVMGATKRVAEMIVQQAARQTGRAYVSVRFGNVLGSRGSVVPIFREQIGRGGPVTVTHPDVRRYFMTIPEAVQLVLQAAALASTDGQGEVFVLDMGEPIPIVDLARDLIDLSGLQVGRDIDIVFTGLRPGEKLYEDLFAADEEHERTRHDKIFVARRPSAHAPVEAQPQFAAQLDSLAAAGHPDEIRRLLQELVPSYQPVA